MTVLCLRHEARPGMGRLAPVSAIGSDFDQPIQMGALQSPPISALWLSHRSNLDAVQLAADGVLYGPSPVETRCESATASYYVVAVDRQGQSVMVGSDGTRHPVSDIAAVLHDIAQNQIHVRLHPNPEVLAKPVFFSDSRIGPFVCAGVVQPLFSSYAELAEVRAYISSLVASESRNPDLAVNPLSADFLTTANHMEPKASDWFLVSAPRAEPDEVIMAVLLTERRPGGCFAAQFHSPVPVTLAPCLVLRREVALPREIEASVSSDCFRILEMVENGNDVGP